MSYPEGLPVTAYCYMEGHNWGREGGGVCLWCGERLRCACGQFVRSDGFEDHFKTTCALPGAKDQQ